MGTLKASLPSIEILKTHDQYALWAIQTEMAMTVAGLWKSVRDGISNNSTTQEKEDDQKAKSFIALHVASHHILRVYQAESAQAAWKALKILHQTTSLARLQVLSDNMQDLRLQSTETVGSYILRAQALRAELEVAGKNITTADFFLQILNGLPAEYDLCRRMLKREFKPDNVDLNAVEAILIQEEQDIERLTVSKATVLGAVTPATLTTGPTNQNKFNAQQPANTKKLWGPCKHCGKPGHRHRDCYSFKKKKPAQP
jgi:hypothetical protein